MQIRYWIVDGGRIAEEGTHDELLAKNGKYARPCGRQSKS